MTKTIYKYVDGKWRPQGLTSWAMTEEYVVHFPYSYAWYEEAKFQYEKLIEKKEEPSECKNTNS